MKNLKLKFIASLLVAFTTFSATHAAYISDDNLRASIVKIEKESLVVHVKKDKQERVKIEIKDNEGKIIYSKKVMENKFSEKYDFSNIADGIYTILVSNESGVIASREFAIFTSREIAMK